MEHDDTSSDCRPGTVRARVLGMVSAVLAAAGPACAQTLTLEWWSMDSGGVMHAFAGEVSLSGTIGQADAGVLLGNDTAIVGGFWSWGPLASWCRPDINEDGALDTRDVILLLNWFSTRDWRADYNGDLQVDSRDVIAFLGDYAAGCP